MISMYEKYVSSYPKVLLFALIILCYIYDVPYVYAVGFVANLIVASGLKLFFRHVMGNAGARPVRHQPTGIFHTALNKINPVFKTANAYGFPSGHSQSVGYFLAFAYQFLPWRTWPTQYVAAALAVLAWLMYTRVAFQRHTPTQVVFGFIFGVMVFSAFHWILTQGSITTF